MRSVILVLALVLAACAGASSAIISSAADTASGNPTMHALVIGTDEPIRGLGACADARALATCLTEKLGVPRGSIVLLTGDGETKPTRVDILKELSQLAKKVKPGDALIFYFSGNGFDLDGEAYLCPQDIDRQTEATRLGTALAVLDVTSFLKDLPTHVLVLAFDMCRTEEQADTGAIVPQRQAWRPGRRGGGAKSTVTLYSSGPGEVSLAREFGGETRGVFSYFFEQALRKEAVSDGGTVEMRKLIPYLQDAMAPYQSPYFVMEGSDPLGCAIAPGRGSGVRFVPKNR